MAEFRPQAEVCSLHRVWVTFINCIVTEQSLIAEPRMICNYDNVVVPPAFNFLDCV